jgi:drug/metabolite transporter (DMT)-like permease
MFGASLTLCPFALWKYWSSRKTRQEWFNFWHQIKWNFCFCGFCYTIFNATFFLALNMTSIGHVYIFSNCHSLLMVVGKFFFKQSGSQLQLHYLEIFGVLIGFIGGTITTLDQQTTAHPTHLTTSSSEQQHQLFSKGIVEVSTSGDLVALLGAFSGCFYLLYAKELRGKLGVWLFLFGMVTVVWVFLIPILFLTLPTLEVSTDPYHGLFGWVFHLNIEAYIVFIGSFCGTMGFVASMKYFEPLVVSVTMLMEPIVATMIGICLGIEAVPGTATFLGGFGVLVGCFLVLLASRTSTKSVEICNKISHSMESHEVTSTVTPEKQRLLSFVSQGEKTNSNTSTKFLSSASNRKTYGSFT